MPQCPIGLYILQQGNFSKTGRHTDIHKYRNLGKMRKQRNMFQMKDKTKLSNVFTDLPRRMDKHSKNTNKQKIKEPITAEKYN